MSNVLYSRDEIYELLRTKIPWVDQYHHTSESLFNVLDRSWNRQYYEEVHNGYSYKVYPIAVIEKNRQKLLGYHLVVTKQKEDD